MRMSRSKVLDAKELGVVGVSVSDPAPPEFVNSDGAQGVTTSVIVRVLIDVVEAADELWCEERPRLYRDHLEYLSQNDDVINIHILTGLSATLSCAAGPCSSCWIG